MQLSLEKVREVGGSISVTRNTLFKLAAEGYSSRRSLLKTLKDLMPLLLLQKMQQQLQKFEKAGERFENLVSFKAGVLRRQIVN